MADSVQLSGVGGDVDIRMVSFHILDMDWTKEISIVNFIIPGQEV